MVRRVLYRRAAGVTSAAEMQIFINGEAREFETVITVADLVATLGLDGRKLAVERNLEIVPKSTYREVALAEGDRLEIVTFIGGG
jgi:thiamine biosynthesis protein ThiS